MLSKRLAAVLLLIDQKDRIADIGCDHGYLLGAALDKGIPFGQGIDNKEGPLKQARRNLTGYPENRFTLTLCSGLQDLDPAVDTAVFCGMGGLLVIDLLSKDLEKAKKLKQLIIQPNNKIEDCRFFLDNHGFSLVKETICEDRHQYYEIMVAQFTGEGPHMNPEDYQFGPLLRRERSEVFIRKWKRILKMYEDAYEPVKNDPDIDIEDLKRKMAGIRKVLGEEEHVR